MGDARAGVRDELADKLLALRRLAKLDERARVERAAERDRGRVGAPPQQRVSEREQRGEDDNERGTAAAERGVQQRVGQRAARRAPHDDELDALTQRARRVQAEQSPHVGDGRAARALDGREESARERRRELKPVQ